MYGVPVCKSTINTRYYHYYRIYRNIIPDRSRAPATETTVILYQKGTYLPKPPDLPKYFTGTEPLLPIMSISKKLAQNTKSGITRPLSLLERF